jgi:CheY-like chemotaxis protein
VAHDFNNLLAPLVGYPELIKSRLPADHPAQQFCDAMVDAASKMASINEDLLALGRRGSFDQVPMELNRLVHRALDQTPLLPEGITVERELAEDLLPIRASAPQLLRVLVNLFANALEAMADSGALTVRTANVYLDTSAAGYDRIERGEYVRLDVQDTGTGIAPEIRSRIFDAFFTTKVAGRRRGSGLGLSVVQAIVEDHGALLDLQTEVGKGTTFSLYFPVARERILEATAEGVKGGTESVLIVDDDPGQREVAQEILASLGYSVDAVSSGKEAVERMRVSPADLVLVDMVMEGGIDGAETLKRIQKARPDQRAIIFSGFAESERVRAALASGAALFLRKPVTLARLAQAVRHVFDEPSRATP